MAIAVQCPHCGKQLRVKDELAGRKGKCPQCQKTIQIPAVGPVPVAAGVAAGGAPAAKLSSTSQAAASESNGDVATKPAPAPVAATAPVRPAPQSYEQIRETVLAAFDGKMTPPKVSILRKLGALIVLLILLATPLFYMAVIGALGFGMYFLATTTLIPWPHPAAFWAAEVAAGLFLLGLIKPLIEPQRRGDQVYPLDPQKETLLPEFTAKICEQIGAKPPKTIQFECSTRMVATKSGSVLILGLPVLVSLSAEQLAALIAGQLAQFRAGSAAGLMNSIRGVNYWLWRSVYGKGRLDRWLSLVAQRPRFSAAKLLLPLFLMRLPAQIVLFIPMFIANTIASTVVRAAEFDCDRAASRLVGKKTFAAVVDRLEQITFVWDGMLMDLKFLSKEQQLPPNLPKEIGTRMQDMTAELCAVLRETVNAPDDKPFDTKPSTPDRMQAVQTEPDAGVFRCPLAARVLLADYEGIARQMSADFYTARFGAKKEEAA